MIMTLRWRLLGAFSLVLALVVGVGWAALHSARALGNLAIETYDGPLQVLNYARAAQVKFAKAMGQSLLSGPLPPSDTIIADILGDLKVVSARSPQNHGLVEAASKALTNWTTHPDTNKAEIEDRLNAITDAAEEQGYAFRSASRDTIADTQRLILITSGAAIALGIVLSLSLAATLSNPLRRMIGQIDALAGGCLDPVADGQISSIAEIKSLSTALEIFRGKLLELDRLRAAEDQQRQEAAHRRRAELTQLAGSFDETINNALFKVADTAKAVADESRAMIADAENASHDSAIVAQTAKESADSISCTLTELDLLTASSSDISTLAAQTGEAVREVDANAQSALSTVESLMSAIARIEQATRLIGAVSKQTNLLALNAMIEAVKAGEAGPGFAIVAREVKTLSTQAADCTGQILACLDEVTKSAGSVKHAVEGIASAVGTVSEMATRVEDRVSEQFRACRAINNSVEQAAYSAGQVSAAIETVSSRVRHTRDALGLVVTAAFDLDWETVALSEASDQFLSSLKGPQAV